MARAYKQLSVPRLNIESSLPGGKNNKHDDVTTTGS